MELNKNLVRVQATLMMCAKEMGDFTRINYVGGNEGHILKLTSQMANCLARSHLLELPDKPSTNHTSELNEVVFFLALNTKFNRQLPQLEQQYRHLINIIPQISKCVLANICFGINLVSHYGYVIENLPLEVTEELLDQTIDCLKKGQLYDNLHNAFVILKSTVNKVSALTSTTEMSEDVLRAASIILQNVTFITTEEIEYRNTRKVYHHMGFIVLRLLDLMLHVDPSKDVVAKFIPGLVSTTCGLLKCVTIDVYCSWVEINEGDEVLQAVISGKAYVVLEKYQKNKMASELVSMLGTIARKPKTIAQRIMEADTARKICMVDENDQHQMSWFRALCLDPFSDAKATACIEKWWKLCDESAVDKLLSAPTQQANQHKQLILKCASNLGVDELCRVVTIHFNKKKTQWSEDITDQLVVYFNQVHRDMNADELKQILLLFLQNPHIAIQQLYINAFKRSDELVQVFKLFKDVSDVENISRKLLKELFEEHPPSCQNMQNYIQLLSSMINCQYHTWDFIVTEVILTRLVFYKKNDQLEEFKCCLQMLKHFRDLDCQLSKEVELYEYILICSSKNRCASFINFDQIRQEIAGHCVDYMLHKCEKFRTLEAKKESFPTLAENCADLWTEYYRKSFWETKKSSLLDTILPGLDFTNYRESTVDQNFTSLLKTLPRCTPSEWKQLLEELAEKFSAKTTLNVLTDIMCLLCDFADNHSKVDSPNSTPLQAIQFCLQNYGAFTASAPDNISDQLEVINDICRVLRHIPGYLTATEGMCLINALPEKPLQFLAADEQFINQIILISDKELRQALAQKVLASSQRNE
ncbi:uncharacterized protein LOC109546250 [Dendroctonus ponderosae]|nr:uncharacterized protein LOC109546250 [Dendroctonus ponderosae]KAH1012591.1 hypothetical protein HUJ05_011724 [Dendroctonus ponderosae]